MIDNESPQSRESDLGEESSVPDDDTSPGAPLTFEAGVASQPAENSQDWDTLDDTGVTPFDRSILDDDSEVDESSDQTSVHPPNHQHYLNDLDESPSDRTDVVTMDFFEDDEDDVEKSS